MDFVVGIVVGLLLYYVFGVRKHISGTFVVIDLHEGLCGLDVTDDFISIVNKKEVTFKVKVDSRTEE